MLSLTHIIGFIFTPISLLLRFSLGLWLATAVAGIIVIHSSHAFPDRDVLTRQGLTVCEGIPCFRGIIPERTDWETGLAIFNGETTITTDPFYMRVILLPSADGQKVDAIFLDRPLDPSFTVGTVIDIFDAPGCVDTYVYHHSGTLILHYPGLHVLTQFTDNHFSSYTRAVTVVLGDPETFSSDPSALCNTVSSGENNGRYTQHSWKGFAYIHDYLRGR
jgi:hypothetical protein